MREVTLYVRTGCHLCDEARELLEALIAERPDTRLVEVDIEADERLHRELLESIPVVEVDGRRVAELLVDVDTLRARLDTFRS